MKRKRDGRGGKGRRGRRGRRGSRGERRKLMTDDGTGEVTAAMNDALDLQQNTDSLDIPSAAEL